MTDETARPSRSAGWNLTFSAASMAFSVKPSGRPLPLNRTAHGVFPALVGDSTTGEWLFTNRGGGPMKSIKKGFAALVSLLISPVATSTRTTVALRPPSLLPAPTAMSLPSGDHERPHPENA